MEESDVAKLGVKDRPGMESSRALESPIGDLAVISQLRGGFCWGSLEEGVLLVFEEASV